MKAMKARKSPIRRQKATPTKARRAAAAGSRRAAAPSAVKAPMVMPDEAIKALTELATFYLR